MKSDLFAWVRRRWQGRVVEAAGGVVTALLLSAVLAACGGPQAQAEKAARAWLDALNGGNDTAAAELSTDATKALLAMGAAMGHRLTPGKYEIKEVRMNGDAAAQVVVRMEGEQSDTTLDLVRVGDTWKVGVKK